MVLAARTLVDLGILDALWTAEAVSAVETLDTARDHDKKKDSRKCRKVCFYKSHFCVPQIGGATKKQDIISTTYIFNSILYMRIKIKALSR